VKKQGEISITNHRTLTSEGEQLIYVIDIFQSKQPLQNRWYLVDLVIENLKQSKFSTGMRQLHLFHNKAHGEFLSPERKGTRGEGSNWESDWYSHQLVQPPHELRNKSCKKGINKRRIKNFLCPERVEIIYLCLKVIDDITYSALFWQSDGMNHYLWT